MKDSFGDRMKDYESRETSRSFLPYIPIYARIDGRSFSALTRKLDRPYDVLFSRCMIETAKTITDKTNARIGYTQSDELSFIWKTDDPKEELFFAGKVQKMCSVLSSMATASFIKELMKYESLYDLVDKLPHFDCRVFQLPNETEGSNAILWREKDACKNAVSMACRSMYSHKSMHGKSSSEMQEMMFEKGVNFNDYPAFFKRGTFVQKRNYVEEIPDETWLKIPEKNRPETRTMERSKIVELDMPIFSTVKNRNDVVFRGEEPIV